MDLLPQSNREETLFLIEHLQKGAISMSIDDNKALVRRYFEALSGKDKATAVVTLRVG